MFIGDGAEWIWRRVADIEDADSVHILDFCHAVDHLAEVCKLLHGQGTEQFDTRLKQWRARLRQDGAAVMIRPYRMRGRRYAQPVRARRRVVWRRLRREYLPGYRGAG